jgi:Icc-related predicted phosphoesterase
MVLNKVKTLPWALPVRIAVLHHPPSPFPYTETKPYAGLLNAGVIKQLLMDKGFCLALCGHVHSGWFVEERWQESASRTLRIAAAPSLGSSEIAEKNGFNLVEILRELNDQSSATYKIQIRRFFYRGPLTWKEDAGQMGPFSPDP